jgi:hypothetical protein
LSEALENPGKSAMFRHVRLCKDDAVTSINAARKVERHEVATAICESFWGLAYGDSVQIDEWKKALILVLRVDPILDRTEIVAERQSARGSDPA